MELQEMQGVGVFIRTPQELGTYLKAADAAGWKWRGHLSPITLAATVYAALPVYIDVVNPMGYGKPGVSGVDRELIDLAELERRLKFPPLRRV